MPRLKTGKANTKVSRNDVNHWITSCLTPTGVHKTIKEIREFLEEKGVEYSGHRGLELRLQSLIDKEIISKKRIPGYSFPTYSIADQELNDIGLQGKIFAKNVKLLDSRARIIRPGLEKHFLNEMINKLGFYILFSYIHSLKLMSNDNSAQRNHQLQKTWLENSLSMQGLRLHFIRGIENLLPTKERDYFSQIYEDKIKIKKLLELEKILEKSYPEDVLVCKKIIDEIPQKIEYEKKLRKQKKDESKRRIKKRFRFGTEK